MQYYQLSFDIKITGGSYLKERDVTNFNNSFDADDFAPDSFAFSDYIRSINGRHVFSSKFKDFFMKKEYSNLIKFEACSIYHGRVDIKEHIDDIADGFFIGILKNSFDIIGKDVTPVNFWPRLKRFKMQDFVIVRQAPENFHIGFDISRPRMIIVSQEFADICRKEALRLSLTELPCCFDSPAPQTRRLDPDSKPRLP